MLQGENTPVRVLMIELLGNIPGKEASVAIAQRAIFDLSPSVRERAIAVLATRTKAEFQQVLSDGVRYPWVPVAEHAAEALMALKLDGAAPALIAALNEADPRLPFAVPGAKEGTYAVRELVRINHMSNCLLCHAPSVGKADLVRGRIPLPGEEPPPLYYAERTGIFIRADVTFLRQDFSVHQPVLNSLKWPGNQRFDYFVRLRKPAASELKKFLALPADYALQHPTGTPRLPP